MSPITYYFDSCYYRMATKPCANGQQVVYLQKHESQRLWQKSSEEMFETAQTKGRKVAKVPKFVKSYWETLK